MEQYSQDKIRRIFVAEDQKWYFSITDAIGYLGESKDPRNYWKVLKNRLKKGQNELVTKCNQLKMKSSDGKSYKTDATCAEVLSEIAQIVSPSKVITLKAYLEDFTKSHPSGENYFGDTEDEEVELLVDGWETDTQVIIRAMMAGVEPENVSIKLQTKKIIIKGKRIPPKKIDTSAYLCQELLWTRFSRTLTLPHVVKREEIKTTENGGVWTIVLTKNI